MAVAWCLGPEPSWGQAGRAARPPESAVVVDSQDRVVGRVEGNFGRYVGIRIKGQMVTVSVRPDRIRAFTTVGFESNDCQGTPFLIPSVAPGTPLFHGEAGIGPGHLLQGVAGPVETRTIGSLYDPDETPPCQPGSAGAQEVYPTVELLDLAIFTPPFRLR